MKQTIGIVLLLIFIFALTGCNSQNNQTDYTTTESSHFYVTEVSIVDDCGRMYKLEKYG